MGVEYRYLLIPRDNTYRPDPAAIQRLIEAWRAHNFAVQPGSAQLAAMDFGEDTRHASAAATGVSLRTPRGLQPFSDDDIDIVRAGELILQWPVSRAQAGELKHPLGLVDEENGTYFDLELHFSDDFVSHAGETIDPIDASCEACGEDLEYDPDIERDMFYASRIRAICPICDALFRPQDRLVPCRDGLTGAESDLEGGATYRFAIVVDCGKCWRIGPADQASAPVATREFLALCSEALGVPLYGVGYFY